MWMRERRLRDAHTNSYGLFFGHRQSHCGRAERRNLVLLHFQEHETVPCDSRRSDRRGGLHRGGLGLCRDVRAVPHGRAVLHGCPYDRFHQRRRRAGYLRDVRAVLRPPQTVLLPQTAERALTEAGRMIATSDFLQSIILDFMVRAAIVGTVLSGLVTRRMTLPTVTRDFILGAVGFMTV